MLNLVFTFLQLNKKNTIYKSPLLIYKINEYKSIVLIKIFTLIKKMKMINLRDFGLAESPQSRGKRKLWLGLWNEIFLDCGYVETMSFLYTIIILKVGLLSYNI